MGAIIYDAPVIPFNLPRSYVAGVVISSDYSTFPTLSGQTISWDSAAGYSYSLRIADIFFAWSSNVYSLDRVMDEPSSSIDCHLFPCFDVVQVRFGHFLNDGKPAIKLQPLATLTTQRFIALPPAPPDYWLQFGG